MYKKFETSWIKHIDFLMIDVFSLESAFALAYLLAFRIFGWKHFVSQNFGWQIFLMLLVANGCAAFLDEGYTIFSEEGIFRRQKQMQSTSYSLWQ